MSLEVTINRMGMYRIDSLSLPPINNVVSVDPTVVQKAVSTSNGVVNRVHEQLTQEISIIPSATIEKQSKMNAKRLSQELLCESQSPIVSFLDAAYWSENNKSEPWANSTGRLTYMVWQHMNESIKSQIKIYDYYYKGARPKTHRIIISDDFAYSAGDLSQQLSSVVNVLYNDIGLGKNKKAHIYINYLGLSTRGKEIITEIQKSYRNITIHTPPSYIDIRSVGDILDDKEIKNYNDKHYARIHMLRPEMSLTLPCYKKPDGDSLGLIGYFLKTSGEPHYKDIQFIKDRYEMEKILFSI